MNKLNLIYCNTGCWGDIIIKLMNTLNKDDVIIEGKGYMSSIDELNNIKPNIYNAFKQDINYFLCNTNYSLDDLLPSTKLILFHLWENKDYP